MADGAARTWKRRSMMSFAEDADPRFADKPEDSAERSNRSPLEKGKKQPKIAFTGEEWGYGYQATDSFLRRARAKGNVPDAGLGAVNSRIEREFERASTNSNFDYNYAQTMPLRTKEQSLMAVKQDTADFAVIPFYHPYTGYDFEALRAMASQFTLLGVDQVEATDKLCLAVHESQLYDIIQSSHPGTGFSALQRRFRKSWGLLDTGSDNAPTGDYANESPRAGLPIDMADQKLIRDRIDVVFAGPEAARRCKSKLDGMRAIGVEVRETSQMIEPHRELARLARSSVNSNRQTNTMFDPVTGKTQFVSTLGADTQSNPLFAMVLPYEVAMRSSDYVIIDHEYDDAAPAKTRFMVVENNPDQTLVEDRYRTTDAKTGYWVRRLEAISNPTGTIGSGFSKMLGYVGGTAAIALVGLGGFGLLTASQLNFDYPPELAWLSGLTAGSAVLLGALVALISWVFLSVRPTGEQGVRVMLRFRRDATAASLGDIENYLRNFGVRHSVVRIDEDSGRDKPSSVVLDIEFDPRDFAYGPMKMLTRRLRGSVLNGALKKSFQRWKNRGVTVLAAMPFEPEQAQLPTHKPRRWWNEAVLDWAADFVETNFAIRLPRLLMFIVLPIAIVVAFVWKVLLNG
ncbi:hypothetical protein ABFZ85_09955 [Hyphococcus formosus]|uniref:hypothetical protein n=1 Tax=Hyphococcus formosus TaxID=3143534 RepID=UPI00398A61C0